MQRQEQTGQGNTRGTHLDLFLGLSSMVGCMRRRLLRMRSEHDNNNGTSAARTQKWDEVQEPYGRKITYVAL